MSIKTNRAIKAITFGATFVALVIILLMGLCARVFSEETQFDAYETVRDAKIGVWADDTTADAVEDATEGYTQPSEPVKSETFYLNNGKKVCFKLESGLSVAYYCD